MNIAETLKIIDDHAKNLKAERDIDIPKTINELNEIPEKDFNSFLQKVNSKEYTVIVFNQGDIYGFFDFIAPTTQKAIKSTIKYLPYMAAISAALFGLISENYILIASLIIPFISGFLTGFIKVGFITVLILIGLVVYFFVNENTVGFSFMIVWTISILLTRFIRYYVQNILLQLSLSDEKIFSLLYYSRLLRLIDSTRDELIYSK